MLEPGLRRRLLKIVGAFFLAQGSVIPSALAARKASTIDRVAFAAFLDVLLPGDDHTASATALRVDRALLSLASRDDRFERLVALGCRWLNMTGTVGFADLQASDRIRIVEWMTTSDWNQVPRRFYELVRQTAVEAYYSHPAALAGLPMSAPPQPLGYPPPWP